LLDEQPPMLSEALAHGFIHIVKAPVHPSELLINAREPGVDFLLEAIFKLLHSGLRHPELQSLRSRRR
jgi:hypothetical protein